jgi:dTMP kinase
MEKRSPPSDTSPPARPGRLIVVEGIDGTGKSTLVARLAAALRARGERVCVSREPTDGPHGKQIRESTRPGAVRLSPEEETDLFIADRREHVAQVIAPALAAGETVLLDRYYYSTMAYQGARGMDPASIEARHRAFAPEPDVLILLDLPVDAALARVTASRGSVPDQFESAEYLTKVESIFRQIEHPGRIVLDAARDPDALAQAILGRLDQC